MKKLLFLTVFSLALFTSYCQSKNTKDIYQKLSAGRVSFGTGDFLGYSIAYEASKNLIKKPSFALNKLLAGVELIFENGTKNPVVHNPSTENFVNVTFNHVSSTILWPKASYYPLNKILPGFNIQAGPTIGYSNRSSEAKASLIVGPAGESTRTSTLFYKNGVIYGYRISAGIEFNISKKLLTGFRLDFSNNNEAEINTLMGLKVGLRM
jgi:hypothetical protein